MPIVSGDFCRLNVIAVSILDSADRNFISKNDVTIFMAEYGDYLGQRIDDVNLTRTEVGLLLRVRDDGLTFDPTAYKADEDEESKFHGIELIRKIASDFKYLRVLNTNNTIMEIKIA